MTSLKVLDLYEILKAEKILKSKYDYCLNYLLTGDLYIYYNRYKPIPLKNLIYCYYMVQMKHPDHPNIQVILGIIQKNIQRYIMQRKKITDAKFNKDKQYRKDVFARALVIMKANTLKREQVIEQDAERLKTMDVESPEGEFDPYLDGKSKDDFHS